MKDGWYERWWRRIYSSFMFVKLRMNEGVSVGNGVMEEEENKGKIRILLQQFLLDGFGVILFFCLVKDFASTCAQTR